MLFISNQWKLLDVFLAWPMTEDIPWPDTRDEPRVVYVPSCPPVSGLPVVGHHCRCQIPPDFTLDCP